MGGAQGLCGREGLELALPWAVRGEAQLPCCSGRGSTPRRERPVMPGRCSSAVLCSLVSGPRVPECLAFREMTGTVNLGGDCFPCLSACSPTAKLNT